MSAGTTPLAPPAEGSTASSAVLRRVVAWCHGAFADDRRWVTGAVLAGLVLRLGWAIAVTGSPAIQVTDPAAYQRVADQIANLEQPTVGGIPSAIHNLGYPVLLVPIVWLHQLTGISVDFGAALLNVAAGTATVGWTAQLARRSIGRRSAAIAAWLVALWPGHIVLTSASLSDVVLTAVGVGATLLAVRAWQHGRTARIPTMLAVGALVGAATAMRGSAIVLLVLPLLLAERRRAGMFRAVVATSAGCLLVLTPFAVRTWVSVGVFAPFGTGGAGSLCLAHRDGATGFPDFSRTALADCYEGSAWDNPDIYRPNDPAWVYVPPGPRTQDEPAWYRRTTDAGVRWAMTHPWREVEMSAAKTKHILTATQGALDGALDSGARLDVGSGERRAWIVVAGAWQYLALIAAAVGVLACAPARRATYAWVVPILLMVLSWGGVALDRYQIQLMPFVVVLAAAGLDRTVRSAPHRRRT